MVVVSSQIHIHVAGLAVDPENILTGKYQHSLTKEAAVIYRSKFGSSCDELKLWGVKPMYMGTL